MSRRAESVLPCPGVRFEPGFGRRLEALAARLALARERREGGGVPSLLGGGAEFVGYRPYARGDDLRALDWDLWARSRRPWVRVARREAGERWLVRLDASASMGVGPPGKLQRAAEVVAGIAALAVRSGVEVRVVVASGALAGARSQTFLVRRRGQLAELLGFLEHLRAGGASGPAPSPRELAQVSRVFVVGDLRDLAPEAALALRSSGRALSLIQILAPVEIAPPAEASVTWWDPERGTRLALALDAPTKSAYESELEAEIGSWRALTARRGVSYGCSSAELSFEDILTRSGAA
jgi:uncharacterized protein (DUF58 family)